MVSASDQSPDPKPGLIGITDERVAQFFRVPRTGIAREAPIAEVHRMAPALQNWIAAFETAPGYLASADANGPPISGGSHKGTHGLWPTRAGYRASFVIWGDGIRPGQLGEISMLEIAPRLAGVVGLNLP